MVGRIIAFSLRNRLIVLSLAALLLLVGLMAVRRSPLDIFPEFAPPQVVVQTEAPGLSAEEVEALVTLPLEYAIGGGRVLSPPPPPSSPGAVASHPFFLGGGVGLMDAVFC